MISTLSRQKWFATLLTFSLIVPGFTPFAAQATGGGSDPVKVNTYGFKINDPTYRITGTLPTAAGALTGGDLDDLTKYVERSCVPMLLAVKNNSTVKQDLKISPWFEFVGGGKQGNVDLEIITTTLGGSVLTSADNLNDFAYPGTSLKNATSFPLKEGGTVAATVAGQFSGKNTGTSAPIATEGFHHYNVVLKQVPKGNTVNMLVCARLAENANQFAGGNITTGVAKQGTNDADHVDVVTSSVLNLPTLSIEKDLIGVPSGTYTYTISPAINGQSVYTLPSGQSVLAIPMVPPAGPYTITETGPSGYVFGSGSGTNCSFSGSTATANPTPDIIANNATCIFTDRLEPVSGRLTVTKIVINNDGGTKTVNDFNLFVNNNTVISGQTLTLEPGSYQVTENEDPLYSVSFSGDCDQNGNVTITAGSNKTCTITNDDRKTSLIVTKVVINDNTGTKTVSDFPLFVNGQPVNSSEERVVTSGTYVVTETTQAGYTGTFSGDCDASGNVTVTAGTSKECIITNDDPAATLTVHVDVINDNGGFLSAGDFPVAISGSSVGQDQAIGLPAGDFAVTAQNNFRYYGNWSGDCDADGRVTLASGDNKACTLTMFDVAVGLIVTMKVINDNGGTAVPSDFEVFVQAIGVPPELTPGSGTGKLYELLPGFFTVFQLAEEGYEITNYEGDCFGTIEPDGFYSCTITNDDI